MVLAIHDLDICAYVLEIVMLKLLLLQRKMHIITSLKRKLSEVMIIQKQLIVQTHLECIACFCTCFPVKGES